MNHGAYSNIQSVILKLIRPDLTDVRAVRPLYIEMSVLIVSADEKGLPHIKTIDQNFDVIQRCTDVSAYVIACLRAEDVLDAAQESSINPIKNQFERNVLLYNWLKETGDVSKYETFLRVMEQKDVGQRHVSNLLRGNDESMKIIVIIVSNQISLFLNIQLFTRQEKKP